MHIFTSSLAFYFAWNDRVMAILSRQPCFGKLNAGIRKSIHSLLVNVRRYNIALLYIILPINLFVK